MKVLNYGSLNVDYVYSVDHIIVGGETQHSSKLEVFSGGKGLNQSVAASKAGIQVLHGGAVGEDGEAIIEFMRNMGIDTSMIEHLPGPSGHAIIEVDSHGNNRIIVCGGTNQQLSKAYIHKVLKRMGEEGDIVLLQNEINCVPYIIHHAHELKMKVVFNCSPIPQNVSELPLEEVDYLIVNEVEGAAITNIPAKQMNFEKILHALSQKYPKAAVILTLGNFGVMCKYGNHICKQNIYRVPAVDTTAAGDTFCGYFLACVCKGYKIQECLKISSAASAIVVSRQGAASSIPDKDEVLKFISQYVEHGESCIASKAYKRRRGV